LTKNSQYTNEICNRYAKALILSSSNKKELEQINKNFAELCDLIKNSDPFFRFISNPLINANKKSKVLTKICSKAEYNECFMGFINVLTKHRKILYYQKIFKEFNKIIDEENGLTEVEVITSEALTQKAQDSIKEKLMNSLNIKIKLKKIVKKDIIGGIIIKIKSMMIDNSIKSKLTNFKT
tara:strand:- start:315 stop:857 length:543 start_codon:yes stop_codon:yes gene_type:complete